MEKQGVSAVTEIKLTREEKKFLKAWVNTGSQSAAYRAIRPGIKKTSSNVGAVKYLARNPHLREAYETVRQQELVTYDISEGGQISRLKALSYDAQANGQHMAAVKAEREVNEMAGLVGNNFRDPGLENIGATLVNFVGEGLARKLLEAQGLPVPTALIEGEAQEVPAKDSAE